MEEMSDDRDHCGWALGRQGSPDRPDQSATKYSANWGLVGGSTRPKPLEGAR